MVEHAVNAAQKLYCRREGDKDTLVRAGGVTITMADKIPLPAQERP